MRETAKWWIHTLWIALLMFAILFSAPGVRSSAGDVYSFDYQDFWKEYREWGYPAGSRLPCNGSYESICTWAWQPWYKHTTTLPIYAAEQYTPRTVNGYALMMRSSQGSGHNIDAGVYRFENNVQMCRTYRFTMYVRSGLEPQIPASSDARMQIGISPTGFAPGQIVLTEGDFQKVVWSEMVNPQYAYHNLSVQTQALGSSITLFTRANPTSDNNPYFFWDEGSFTEVAHTGDLVDITQPLPPPQGGLVPTAAPGSTSAQISWSTAGETLGQVLYREVSTATSPGDLGPHKVFLPLVTGAAASNWRTTPVQSWAGFHSISLTDLKPGTTYQYVVVSYGSYSGQCTTLISETSLPRTFTTLGSP